MWAPQIRPQPIHGNTYCQRGVIVQQRFAHTHFNVNRDFAGKLVFESIFTFKACIPCEANFMPTRAKQTLASAGS